MMNLELEYNNTQLFDTCFLAGQSFIETISASLEEIYSNISSFSFFDLGLSDSEKETLSQINITKFNDLMAFGNLESLQDRTENFLSKLALESSIIQETTKIITRTINGILAASDYDGVRITMVADPGNYDYSPYLHIDKTHTEILNICQHNNLKNTKPTFVFALKGDTTLYYSLSFLEQNQFDIYAEHSTSSYGYKYNLFNISQNPSINIANSYQPNFGQGAVHLAGLEFGTIHAAPNPEGGRLIVVLMPDYEWAIRSVELAFS